MHAAKTGENAEAPDPLGTNRREHSSELQPERNALHEDMTRLFLIPPRYESRIPL